VLLYANPQECHIHHFCQLTYAAVQYVIYNVTLLCLILRCTAYESVDQTNWAELPCKERMCRTCEVLVFI
jgi:hypothetical protein